MTSDSVNQFRRTRSDHARETAEDYVEMVRALTRDKGEARAVEIALRLGVSQVTVSKTLQRLQREGLLTFQPYRSIFLTDAGRELAEASHRRHALVLEFLLKLGVEPEVAEIDAEGLEHHVSEQTLEAMRRYLSGE